ncbi:hypothetical protein Avbf_12453 [Armadillidium vulgare]|nr:hypothetical protein Avbf_12453 [Armadillidium vulgare]
MPNFTNTNLPIRLSRKIDKVLVHWCMPTEYQTQSMGASLLLDDKTSRSSSEERKTKCENPLCDMQLWKVKHDLDFARLRLFYLEKQLISSGIWKTPRKRIADLEVAEKETKICRQCLRRRLILIMEGGL